MRVIAGTFRSRLLTAPRGDSTRPTSDRLREALFNILAARAGGAGLQGVAELQGTRFVDLYAGTGAVGIEAVSRGAARVWFAEKAEPALAALRANLQALGIREGTARAGVGMVAPYAGMAAGVEIEARGTGALLEQLAKAADKDSTKGGMVDMVYLDPPWEAEQEYARTLEFLGGERGRAMLAEGALVIAEHSAKRPLAEKYAALLRTRELKQGDAALSFYARAE